MAEKIAFGQHIEHPLFESEAFVPPPLLKKDAKVHASPSTFICIFKLRQITDSLLDKHGLCRMIASIGAKKAELRTMDPIELEA